MPSYAQLVRRLTDEYLCHGLSHRAALAEPKDLVWLLAPYARDGLAQAEAAADAPSLHSALEDGMSTSCRD